MRKLIILLFLTVLISGCVETTHIDVQSGNHSANVNANFNVSGNGIHNATNSIQNSSLATDVKTAMVNKVRG